MNVLLCHTYYRQRGGEDCGFEEERDMLESHGHRVSEYVRRNDDLTGVGPLKAASQTVWNRRAVREIAELIQRERPEVLHCTNTFPLISPGVCHVAHGAGVAVVQALRNYRLLCAGSYLMREGRPCEDCVSRAVPWPAIVHRCYRDSIGATAAVVGMQMSHRVLGTWRRKVDAFFTLTEFARQRFVAAGFEPQRVHVKNNSVAPDPGVRAGLGGFVAFVARLSPEKGVATVLEAWRRDRSLPPLKVVGDGPMEGQVQAAAEDDDRIAWLGHLAAAEVHQVMGEAMALIMPSLWYETFGRTIAEAFSVGTPVIASRLGAMIELVDDDRTGWHFNAGDAADLAAKVCRLTAAPREKIQAMRSAARGEYEARFTADRNYARLMEIYAAAVRSAERRRATLSLVPMAAGG
jgi:glycosyltransferase involved in cell wall biosynthesis